MERYKGTGFWRHSDSHSNSSYWIHLALQPGQATPLHQFLVFSVKGKNAELPTQYVDTVMQI